MGKNDWQSMINVIKYVANEVRDVANDYAPRDQRGQYRPPSAGVGRGVRQYANWQGTSDQVSKQGNKPGVGAPSGERASTYSGTARSEITSGKSQSMDEQKRTPKDERKRGSKDNREASDKNTSKVQELQSVREEAVMRKKSTANASQGAEPYDGSNVSVERLQEAVVWSEILGKPVSKRRESRRWR